MNELRTILFILGVIIIVGVAFHGIKTQDMKAKFRRRSEHIHEDESLIPEHSISDELLDNMPTVAVLTKHEQNTNLPEEFKAKVDSDILFDHIDEKSPALKAEIISENMMVNTEQMPVENDQINIILFSIHCREHRYFTGVDILNIIRKHNLIYDDNMLHCYVDNLQKPVFSIVNMMHPGTFELNSTIFTTKGISCFMLLPCEGNAKEQFNFMLSKIQQIADELKGDILDEERKLITPELLSAYRSYLADLTK